MPSVPLRTHGIDPAELPSSRVECRPLLDVQVTRQQPPEERKAAVEATLDGLPEAQLQLWTDGAAEGGTKNGGAGYVVLGREGGEIDGGKHPVGKFTCSATGTRWPSTRGCGSCWNRRGQSMLR